MECLLYTQCLSCLSKCFKKIKSDRQIDPVLMILFDLQTHHRSYTHHRTAPFKRTAPANLDAAINFQEHFSGWTTQNLIWNSKPIRYRTTTSRSAGQNVMYYMVERLLEHFWPFLATLTGQQVKLRLDLFCKASNIFKRRVFQIVEGKWAMSYYTG